MDHNLIDKQNITGYQYENLKEITPKNREELKNIVIKARETKQALYPISTGYNWGLGSKIPVKENCTILNLSLLNNICEYDAKNGYVVIEPGVTQKQLELFLISKNSDYYVDVTGSSKETSIVGNALERGISYNSLRVENVMGLEVLTGEGNIIKTGSWRIENSNVKFSYKYGVGAELTGLFFQSNFGIVTKMVYKLRRRENERCLVQLQFNCVENIAKSLPIYSELFSEGIINSIFHIANSQRAKGAVLPQIRKTLEKLNLPSSHEDADQILRGQIKFPWVATGVLVASDENMLKVKKRIFKKKLKPYTKIIIINFKLINFATKLLSFFPKSKLFNLLKGVSPFNFLYFGEATNAALGSVLKYQEFKNNDKHAHLVDKGDKGFIYCLPLTNLSQESCLEMFKTISQTAQSFNYSPSITLNPVLPDVLEAVVSLDFDKSESQKAHECIHQLQKNLIEKGHIPYRTNVRDMNLFFKNDSYLKYLKKIKQTFDPDNIISPGRYLPEDSIIRDEH